MTELEHVNVELNSEKSEKAVNRGNSSTDNVKGQLKLFKIATGICFLLALIFLIALIIVASTGNKNTIPITIFYLDDDDNDNNTTGTPSISSYNTWEQLKPVGSIPDIRLAHGSAVYNKELLIIYGLSDPDTGDILMSDIWSYSPINKVWNKWNTTGTAPTGRYHFASVVCNNFLYIHGGFLNFEGTEESSQDFFRLNLQTKEWEDLTINDSTTTQPNKRGAHEMVEYKGTLYIFGGSTSVKLGLYDDLWSYNIATKTWKEITPAKETDAWPSSRLGFNFYVADDAFWLFAGTCKQEEEPNCDNGQQNDLWRFFPSNSSWQELEPTGENIPMARRASHAEVTISEHTFLIGGLYIGTTGPVMLNDVHVYDIETNRWIQLHPEWPDEAQTNVMTKRFGHSVEEIDNKLYVFGGRCGNMSVKGCNDLWVYTPPYFASQAN